MTIGQKIIFSSSLVAFLAALAPFMGVKNTQSVRNNLVETLSQTTEEIRKLDEIKTQMTVIQSDIYRSIKEVNMEMITDKNKYFKSGRFLENRVEEMKTQIENFHDNDIHPTIKKELEELPLLCNSILSQVKKLFPSNNALPNSKEAFSAGVGTKKIVDQFMGALQTANNKGYEIIENQGKTVQAEINGLNFWIMIIGGLTCLMAIVFGRIIASNLSSEISKLRNAATKLNSGDYSARVGMTSNDEFGKLGQTFDGMAANLEQSKVIEEQKTEMERLNNELKIKNNSLDSFVYRVSHDLKAPVINIRSLLKMIQLKMKVSENTEFSQPFFFLDKSVDKLENTISDLLEVSRIEKSLETSKEWINLEEKLEQIKTENSENIFAGDVIITSNLEVNDLYFSVPNLDSILSNIITNGIKYRSMKRQPEIHLETKRKDNFISLKISDNGIGMDLEKHKEKLFGMFNRFHDHVDGSGVGLYIVKKIVEDSGGKIEVESEVEKGTTFTILFNQENVPAKMEMELG